MTQSHDITIKKPLSVWKRDLSFSFQDIFFPLGKAAISGVTLDSKGVAENVFEAIKGIVPQDQPAYAAWILIFKSLSQSLGELTKEYKYFFLKEEIKDSEIANLTVKLENDLDAIEAGLDADFFDNPQKLELLENIKPSLLKWLTGLGMEESQATALHLRLKSHFALSLHKQWLADPQEYACIGKAVDSPFLNAKNSERVWIQYREWLQEKTNERMFDEAFSLSQVYVPLRSYYEVKKEQKQENDEIEEHNNANIKRIVVDLHLEMESWLINFDPDNALRVISGGPGTGKSSFAKMFAAYASREKKEINVIFIPLHQFDPSGDLYTALDQFIKEDRFLTINPLAEKKERLLLIFDGLDEISMQGRAAAETARFFVDEVGSKINKYNGQNFQYQAIITGRDVAIQSASGYLRKQGQILHVLPYYVSDDEAKEYTDEKHLLKEDQRNQWWKNYGIAKNLAYKSLPDELKIDNLTPITREPLLNYLVALSYERGVKFSDKTTLNEIYNELLDAVHKRQWDHGTHKGTQHLTIGQFTRVLEEIALCVWHGDGRTATVKQIYNRCHGSKLINLLEGFQEGAEKGVSRLLTAFYFRQCDKLQEGERTFEFTHKSFGEYLTAKRIVRTVNLIDEALRRNDKDPDIGIDERSALKRWARICGPTTIDQYVFNFLCDEVAVHKDKLEQWQKTFAKLISFTVRNEMPMENSGLSTFKEMKRQARNAEDYLMVIYTACAIKTKEIVKIDWGKDKKVFGEWTRRLQEHLENASNGLILECLDFWDLVECSLDFSDFYDENKKRSLPKSLKFRLRTLARKIKKIRTNKIPETINDEVISIATTIDYWAARNRTINVDFAQISNSFELFLNNLIDIFDKIESGYYDGDMSWHEFSSMVGEILDRFSRILTERSGNGQRHDVNPREITKLFHSSSLAKILNRIELYGNMIIHESIAQYRNHFFPEEEGDSLNFVCLQLSKSIFPKVEKMLNGSFITFPFNALVSPENWFYLLHELGHVIYNIMLEEVSFYVQIDTVQKSIVSEMFADYFCCCLVCDRDSKKYFHLSHNFIVSLGIEDMHNSSSVISRVFLTALLKKQTNREFQCTEMERNEILFDIQQHYDDTWLDRILEHLNEDGPFQLIKFIDELSFVTSNVFINKVRELISEVYNSQIVPFSNNKFDLQEARKRFISELWFDYFKGAEKLNGL